MTERHFDHAIHIDGHPTHSSLSLEIIWKPKFHIDTAGIIVDQVMEQLFSSLQHMSTAASLARLRLHQPPSPSQLEMYSGSW